MEIEVGKTHRYLREKQGVPKKATEQLKEYNRIKRAIKKALEEGGELTVKQISEQLEMTLPDTVFYLMTLVKYGEVLVGELDDMDEYYTYKLNK